MLKRLESSVYSFRLTIDRIKKLIEDTVVTINNYQSGDCVLNLAELSDSEDFDYDEDVIYDVTCPNCGEELHLDEETILEDSIHCPKCNELLEFDFDEDDESDDEPF